MNGNKPNPSNPSLNKPYQLDAYYYDLPTELIAQHPLAKRDEARLMVIDRAQATIRHDIFANLNKYLPPRSALVLNNSRVIPARLLGKRSVTGGEVEVFLLKALDDGYCFEALLRPLKKIREGETLHLGPGVVATLIDKDKRIVRFNKKNIIEHLEGIGHIPLPPYIKRDDAPSDAIDYQTVYAKRLGSVASPTAGLHFSERLLAALAQQGHQLLELTLHINYGTFKPVECADIRQHPMHHEPYVLSKQVHEAVGQAKHEKKPVVAVGTTSCRVLEAVAASGVLAGETNIFMYSGYEFKAVDHLITNFHLPQSTLLMLVCAFGGYDLMMRAYAEAIKERYRFYSYGDAMLII